MVKEAQPGEQSCGVGSSWESETFPLFLLYPYMYSVGEFLKVFFQNMYTLYNVHALYVLIPYCIMSFPRTLNSLDRKPQSTYRGRDEIGEAYLPSQLERTLQLCTWWWLEWKGVGVHPHTPQRGLIFPSWWNVLAQLSLRKRTWEHVLHCDGSIKVLAIPTVWAKMLSCKLLSTAAAFVNHMMWWKSPTASHSRTLYRTLWYGEKLSDIARQLDFC